MRRMALKGCIPKGGTDMATAEVIIHLDSYENFKRFVNGIEKYDANITAYTLDRERRVDGKSLIGILTLDPMKDFILTAQFDREAKRDEFLCAMKQFEKK